jgi:hypothetical protein
VTLRKKNIPNKKNFFYEIIKEENENEVAFIKIAISQ